MLNVSLVVSGFTWHVGTLLTAEDGHNINIVHGESLIVFLVIENVFQELFSDGPVWSRRVQLWPSIQTTVNNIQPGRRYILHLNHNFGEDI